LPSGSWTDAVKGDEFTGTLQGAVDMAPNGMVYVKSPPFYVEGAFVSLANVTDGTSNTLLVGEWVPYNAGKLYVEAPAWQPALAFGINGGGVARPIGVTNFFAPTPPYGGGHFGSFHPGGANFLLADGSVRFLSYALVKQLPDGSKSIIEALATRAGEEVIDGSNH
jgi:prepilin-type processing-associated H-X9-DG protein